MYLTVDISKFRKKLDNFHGMGEYYLYIFLALLFCFFYHFDAHKISRYMVSQQPTGHHPVSKRLNEHHQSQEYIPYGFLATFSPTPNCEAWQAPYTRSKEDMVISVGSHRRSIRDAVLGGRRELYKPLRCASFYDGLAAALSEATGSVSLFGTDGGKKARNVLILMSDTGGGHRASAEALRDAFRLEYGDAYQVRPMHAPLPSLILSSPKSQVTASISLSIFQLSAGVRQGH
jgi:hypothetical protein